MKKCSRCSSTDNVTFDSDPYQSEIHGDETPVYLCERCRWESAWDI